MSFEPAFANGDRVIVDPAPGSKAEWIIFDAIPGVLGATSKIDSAILFARIRGTVAATNAAPPTFMAAVVVDVDLDQRAVPGALPRSGPPRRVRFGANALRKLDAIELLGELAWA